MKDVCDIKRFLSFHDESGWTKSRVTRMYISALRNFEYNQTITKKAQNCY